MSPATSSVPEAARGIVPSGLIVRVAVPLNTAAPNAAFTEMLMLPETLPVSSRSCPVATPETPSSEKFPVRLAVQLSASVYEIAAWIVWPAISRVPDASTWNSMTRPDAE